MIGKYSIEFSHIYTNESFADEHVMSVKEYISLKKKYSKDSTCSSVIMIDNYNSTENILNIDSFLSEIQQLGAEPDFIFFEGDLVRYTKSMLDLMSPKDKKEFGHYINKKNKIPCSMLVCIFYLLRLGIFKISSDINVRILSEKKIDDLYSDIIINILSFRYKGVEERVKNILNNSTDPLIAGITNKIISHFY